MYLKGQKNIKYTSIQLYLGTLTKFATLIKHNSKIVASSKEKTSLDMLDV